MWERRRVLVVVKATPQPSRSYGDTVCVAGVDISGDGPPRWVRLYPVPFRYLDGEQQFHKYDVIDVEVKRNPRDKRPESWQIKADTLQIIGHAENWEDRYSHLREVPTVDMCQLLSGVRADPNAPSLGWFAPANMPKLALTKHHGWTAAEQARFDDYRNQDELFRDVPPRMLLAPRFRVHIQYRCGTCDRGQHNQSLIDWELTALQNRMYRNSDDEVMAAVHRNFLEIPFSTGRAPRLFVGNQESAARRSAYLVLGLFYPRTADLEKVDDALF